MNLFYGWKKVTVWWYYKAELGNITDPSKQLFEPLLLR